MITRILVLIGILVATTSCDLVGRPVTNHNNSALTISSRASFVAWRDGLDGKWQLVKYGDAKILPNTTVVSIKDSSKRYEVIFVCQSFDVETPTRVTFIRATLSELSVIDQVCYKDLKNVEHQLVRGEVKGLKLDQPSGNEIAIIASGADNQLSTSDSYATWVPRGTRDFIAYKGVWQESDDSININEYIVNTANVSTIPANLNMNFDSAARATRVLQLNTATINNLPNGNWRAAIHFRTQNKTRLRLKDFTVTSSGTVTEQYFGVPLYTIDAAGQTTQTLFQQPTEGHEIVAESQDPQGRISMQAHHLFKRPHDAISLSLPTQPATGATAEISNLTPGLIVTSMPAYSDTTFGGLARLHLWRFAGEPAPATAAKPGQIVVPKLEWDIYVAQNSLNANSMSVTQFDSPSITETVEQNVGGIIQKTVVERFLSEWSFKQGTPLSWELHHYGGTGKLDAWMDFIINQDFTDGIVFGEAIQYSQ